MSDHTPDRPVGQRFSLVYLRNADLMQDSQRARRRVAALLGTIKDLEALPGHLVREIGVDVTWGIASIDWANTLRSFALRDFLDVFTVACRLLENKRLRGTHNTAAKGDFVKEVARIFAEENLRYEIDAEGGVHFKVDSEFAATTNAAIAALGAARYANAREQFEIGMAALSRADVDGKQGIRGVFSATECVFKLMYNRPRLAAGDVTKSLKPTVQRFFSADPTALRAANKSVEAFAEWVDACHYYRHEQGVEEPLQPPIDLAVQLISVGSGFLRWLIAIDRQTGA